MYLHRHTHISLLPTQAALQFPGDPFLLLLCKCLLYFGPNQTLNGKRPFWMTVDQIHFIVSLRWSIDCLHCESSLQLYLLILTAFSGSFPTSFVDFYVYMNKTYLRNLCENLRSKLGVI